MTIIFIMIASSTSTYATHHTCVMIDEVLLFIREVASYT